VKDSTGTRDLPPTSASASSSSAVGRGPAQANGATNHFGSDKTKGKFSPAGEIVWGHSFVFILCFDGADSAIRVVLRFAEGGKPFSAGR
jgi:hypothetical protein